LRKTGHSIPEIKKITGRSAGSVLKYIKGVEVSMEYRDILRIKQGGSRERAKTNWANAKYKASNIIQSLSDRDLAIFLTGIYWGEGSKKDFNLVNGDPYLIRAFVRGLYSLGVRREQIKFNFRLFSDMDQRSAINYWISFLNISPEQVGWSEIIPGNGSKKLAYGMCRVRVIKPDPYFKLVMSMIDFIKTNTTPL
jgi:hypothetical protein